MSTWTLKRNDTSETLTLHSQYVWVDEMQWSKIARSKPVRLFGGGIDIQEGTKKAGRPISLDGKKAVIKYGDLKRLRDWTDVPELTMTLTHPDGRTFKVTFTDAPIASTKGLFKEYRPADMSDDDDMQADINLLTI